MVTAILPYVTKEQLFKNRSKSARICWFCTTVGEFPLKQSSIYLCRFSPVHRHVHRQQILPKTVHNCPKTFRKTIDLCCKKLAKCLESLCRSQKVPVLHRSLKASQIVYVQNLCSSGYRWYGGRVSSGIRADSHRSTNGKVWFGRNFQC